MSTLTFEQHYRRLQGLFQAQEFRAAFDLSTSLLEDFPEERTALDYWRMTLAAHLGDTTLTLNILRQALDAGQWYSEILLRGTPALQSLQGNPDFERLLARNQEIAETDRSTSYPLYVIRPRQQCQAGSRPCPLLIGLHDNAATARQGLPFWAPAATAGWLVAAPQSSQALWKDAYIWDDRQIALAEIVAHYRTLLLNYHIDEQRVILAAHHRAADLALWLAFSGDLEISGFLIIAPTRMTLGDRSFWEALLGQVSGSRLRGYFLLAQHDPPADPLSLKWFVERLDQAQIPCRLAQVSRAGIHHQPAYDPAIVAALDFLSQPHIS